MKEENKIIIRKRANNVKPKLVSPSFLGDNRFVHSLINVNNW